MSDLTKLLKIGDRVRMTNPHSAWFNAEGVIVAIASLKSNLPYTVNIDKVPSKAETGAFDFADYELELIDSDPNAELWEAFKAGFDIESHLVSDKWVEEKLRPRFDNWLKETGRA